MSSGCWGEGGRGSEPWEECTGTCGRPLVTSAIPDVGDIANSITYGSKQSGDKEAKFTSWPYALG